MHALIQNDQIIQIGVPPRVWWDGDRWYDLRDDVDGTYAASLGWLPVQTDPRPADTATTTWDRADPALVDGLPVIGWTERPWTEDELAARAEAEQQQVRYETHEAILDATAALMQQAHADGEAWTQPIGAHDAYPLGTTVTHGGKTWENITHANVWEPGVSGWREQVTEGYPAWVRPTGGHDAYNAGDRVSFEGTNYESRIDGNTWSPADYPAGWRELT